MEIALTIMALIVSIIALKPIYDRFKLERSRKTSDKLLFNRKDLVNDFVGREKEMRELNAWYHNENLKIISITGLGGQGKTSLLTHWLEDKENIKMIWWAVYDNPSIEGLFEQLLVLFDETSEEYMNAGLFTKLIRLKEYIGIKKRLIIIDGFEKFQNEECEIENPQLRDFLHYAVKRGNSKIIIGSRHQIPSLIKYNGHSSLNLKGLSETDIIKYFELKHVQGDYSKVGKIMDLFNGHALSISILQDELRKSYANNLNNDLGSLLKIGLIDSPYDKVNFLLKKYEKSLNNEQIEILKIFSLFPRIEVNNNSIYKIIINYNKYFNNNLFENISGLYLSEYIKELTQRSLIKIKNKNTLTSHTLIKNYFSNKVKSPKEYFHLIFKSLYPIDDNTSHDLYFLQDLVYFGVKSNQADFVFQKIYRDHINQKNQSYLTMRQGKWGKNLEITQLFFKNKSHDNILIQDTSSIKYLYNEVGLSYLNIGNPTKSMEIFDKLLEVISNSDIQAKAIALYHRSGLNYRLDRLNDALFDIKNSLIEIEKLSDKELENHIKARLAYIYFLKGRIIEATDLFNLTEEYYNNNRLKYDILRGIPVIKHADFLFKQGEIDKAKEIADKKLSLCLANNWVGEVARCKRVLASIEMERNNYDKAASLIEEALAMSKIHGTPEIRIQSLSEKIKLQIFLSNRNTIKPDLEEVKNLINDTGFLLYKEAIEIYDKLLNEQVISYSKRGSWLFSENEINKLNSSIAK